MTAAKLAPVGPGLLTGEMTAVLRERPAAVHALARRGELAFIRCGKSRLFRPWHGGHRSSKS